MGRMKELAPTTADTLAQERALLEEGYTRGPDGLWWPPHRAFPTQVLDVPRECQLEGLEDLGPLDAPPSGY